VADRRRDVTVLSGRQRWWFSKTTPPVATGELNGSVFISSGHFPFLPTSGGMVVFGQALADRRSLICRKVDMLAADYDFAATFRTPAVSVKSMFFPAG
jgi:hypothetical protein